MSTILVTNIIPTRRNHLFNPQSMLVGVVAITLSFFVLDLQCSNAAGKPAGASSSLDHLKADQIPAEDRSALHPKELVAILGTDRGRCWSPADGLVFSPDGKMVACAGAGAFVYLRDAISLRELAVIEVEHLPGAFVRIEAIAFSPDGKKLALQNDAVIWLYDLLGKKPKVLGRIKGHEDLVYWLAFLPDGNQLASASIDKTVRLWDLAGAAPKERAVLEASTYGAALSPDGKKLALGNDGALELWDISEPEPKDLASTKFPVRDWQVWRILPDCRTVVTKDYGPRLRFWKQEGNKFTSIGTMKAAGENVGLNAEATLMATSTLEEDCCVRLWKIENMKATPLLKLGGLPAPAYRFAFSPDSKTVACDEFVAVQVFRLNGAESPSRSVFHGHRGGVECVAFSPDGNTLATGSTDETIRLWDLTGAQAKEIATLNGHSGEVDRVAFSPDGMTLASASRDGTVRLWHLHERKPRQSAVLITPKSQVNSMAFSPDGKKLQAAFFEGENGKGQVWIWNLQGKEPKVELKLNDPERTYGAVFANNGWTLAAAGINRTLLWDLQDPTKPIANLDRMWGQLAISPDGKTLAGEVIESISLLDVSQGKPRVKAKIARPDQSEWLESLVFSPDGKKLAGAEHGGRGIIWDIPTLKILSEWKFAGGVAGLAFAPDGRHLATANANGTAYILRLKD